MTQLQAIIFDFDGVLCNDYFYQTLKYKKPLLHKQIDNVFKQDKDLIRDWMRGKITSWEFNKVLADKFKVSQNFLQSELEQGVKEMRLNEYLLNFAWQVKERGIKTSILTDNMDIFHKVMVPTKKLHNYFDYIFSSCEYNRLKLDREGELIKKLVNKLQVEFSDVLVLDDWAKVGDFIRHQGGNFYLFKPGNHKQEFDKFYSWFKNNF